MTAQQYCCYVTPDWQNLPNNDYPRNPPHITPMKSCAARQYSDTNTVWTPTLPFVKYYWESYTTMTLHHHCCTSHVTRRERGAQINWQCRRCDGVKDGRRCEMVHGEVQWI
jgi:hypothetical protein